MSTYDFGALYGRADNSNILLPEGPLDAVVEKANWGQTRDGTKGQWTVTVRSTTGEFAGRTPVTQTITISPENEKALGIMFRHLAALGIPVPDPKNPQVCVNGDRPFWMMGWGPDQVAQAMVGRQVTIINKHDDYNGLRNKITDWQPPRPGAPTTWPVQQQQPQASPWATPQQGYAAPGAPQGYGAPAYPQQPPFAQQPYTPPQPQGFPQQPYAQGAPVTQGPPQQFPGTPSWAQPPVPGQGGTGEFTPQGQSYQPSHMDPNAPAYQPPPQGAPASQGYQPPQFQPPQAPQQGPPVMPWQAQQPQPPGAPNPQGGPPWQGPPQPGPASAPGSQGVPPQPPWQPQNGYPQQPAPQGPQQPQQEGPPPPPWA
jgi:hypothetical protein